MFILYLDDAGSVTNASDRHIVLAGVALFERQIHFLDNALSDLAQKIAPDTPEELEFHGSHMLAGKGFWRSISDKTRRRQYIAEALAIFDNSLRGEKALFGAVIEKQVVSPNDPFEIAFEQLVSRFDQYLAQGKKGGRLERGLLVLDKSK